MRYSRQNKILEIIGEKKIDTQEQLADELKKEGYNVTQATVSRDIRELGIIKIPTPSGGHRYALSKSDDRPAGSRELSIISDTILSISSSENIIVIKTLTACANAACESVDSLGLKHIIGSLAGDNTFLIIADDRENVPSLIEELKSLIR